MESNTKRKKLSVPRPWGHEQFLSSLVGQNVCVTMPNSEFWKGVLKSFDRYTILIEAENGVQELVFKSAIQGVSKDSL